MIGKMKPGSALLFVMMIIAGVIAFTIGSQRLALVQYSQAVRVEDNTYAYQAARSGIEDGLLRFRYNRNVESKTENHVYRLNLSASTNQDMGEVLSTRAIDMEDNYQPTNTYYDLNINYKAKQLGDFVNIRNADFILKKDEHIDVTGFALPVGGNELFLHYAFRTVADTCANGVVQLELIDETGSLPASLRQRTVSLASNELWDSASKNLNFNLKPSAARTSTIRIRAYRCDVHYALSTAKGISDNNSTGEPPAKIDSQYTTITSVGYFGKVKRGLQAKIDRRSGTLLGIYDFNLYGNKSISP